MFASPPFLLYSVRTVNSCGKGGGNKKGTRQREDSRHALYSTIFACEFFLAAFSSTTKTRFVRMRGTSSREHFAKLPYGLPSPPTNGPQIFYCARLLRIPFPISIYYYSHLEPTTLTGPGLAIRAAALTAVVAVVVVVAFVVGVPGVVIAGVELVVMKVFENLCKWGACRSAST